MLGLAPLAGVSLPNFYSVTGADRRSLAQGRDKEETKMDIHPCGSRPSRRGPADSFTGVVWQEPII
ncbi:MAG: hypothetical protein WBD33_08635, partial [Xanthobacteraceae bacterium]